MLYLWIDIGIVEIKASLLDFVDDVGGGELDLEVVGVLLVLLVLLGPQFLGDQGVSHFAHPLVVQVA